MEQALDFLNANWEVVSTIGVVAVVAIFKVPRTMAVAGFKKLGGVVKKRAEKE